MLPFNNVNKIDLKDLPLIVLKALPILSYQFLKLNNSNNQEITFNVCLTDYTRNTGVLYFTYRHSNFPEIYGVLLEGNLDLVISKYNQLIKGDIFFSVLYSAFYVHLFKFVNIEPIFKSEHNFSSYISNNVKETDTISVVLNKWHAFVSDFYLTIDKLIDPSIQDHSIDYVLPLINKLSGIPLNELFAIAEYRKHHFG